MLDPLSAVIPNRDGADLLRRTLPPLLRELPPDRHEILVIDDASEDDSIEMLAREFPSVRVVGLRRNVGFGAACNRGFEEARNDLVLLLNSDMEVTPGSLELLLEHFADPKVFAAGPEYRSTRPDAPPPPRALAPVFPQVGAPAGGGVFRRRAYLHLGGFDLLYYPFYWEDLDLGWQAWRRGWRVLYDSRAHFLHLESATIRRLYSQTYVDRVRARNRALFGWKNLTTSALRRRHSVMLVRRAIVDLVRRRSAAALAALPEAWAIARQQGLLNRRDVDGLSDEEILRASGTDLEALLRL